MAITAGGSVDVGREAQARWFLSVSIPPQPMVDVTTRPWYRHAVERGAGFTEPYADPTSGEGLVSFVAPLRERAGGPVVGVVIAGSFLDPRGDAKRAAEV